MRWESHWELKERWIREAIEAGGEGEILCLTCEICREYGFGSTGCQGCGGAIRRFPGGEWEDYPDPSAKTGYYQP